MSPRSHVCVGASGAPAKELAARQHKTAGRRYPIATALARRAAKLPGTRPDCPRGYCARAGKPECLNQIRRFSCTPERGHRIRSRSHIRECGVPFGGLDHRFFHCEGGGLCSDVCRPSTAELPGRDHGCPSPLVCPLFAVMQLVPFPPLRVETLSPDLLPDLKRMVANAPTNRAPPLSEGVFSLLPWASLISPLVNTRSRICRNGI